MTHSQLLASALTRCVFVSFRLTVDETKLSLLAGDTAAGFCWFLMKTCLNLASEKCDLLLNQTFPAHILFTWTSLQTFTAGHRRIKTEDASLTSLRRAASSLARGWTHASSVSEKFWSIKTSKY